MEENKPLQNIDTIVGQVALYNQKISGNEYIEFLSRTDLGKQYPKERFISRISKLVANTQISIIAKDEERKIIGNCFGITDFAYWLLITDIGIDRKFVKHGIGKAMMEIAREIAGGKKDIVVFTYANEDAIGFYEKIGMRKSDCMMELADVDWTPFEVGKDQI